MSVVSMSFISIIGFLNELDATATTCASTCAFEPDNVDNFFKDADKFQSFVNNNDSISLENELISIIEKIGKKINISNESPMISKRQISKYISSLSEKCDKISNKITKLNHEIKENIDKIGNLSHFIGLNHKIDDVKRFEYIDTKFVEISKPDFEFLEKQDNSEKVIVNKVSNSGEKYYSIMFISKEFKNDVDGLIRKLKIREIDISDFKLTPKEEIERLKCDNKQIELEINRLKLGIDKFWQHQSQYCSNAYSCLTEYEKIETVKKFAKTYNNNFVLVGWIPKNKITEISEKLDKISRIEYSIESGNEILSFSPPTKLKNNNIFSPFELFVLTYGLPKYSDIDPTSFVAITYTIIFGIMFADVGQGLFLASIGLFLDKVKKMNLGKVITICGLSSSIFGFAFGSVFGFEHLLDNFYKSFGFAPIRVMESSMSIIISSICIGIFCLVLAMCVNIYSLINKHNDFLEALLSHSGVCGIILYLSLVSLLTNSIYNSNVTVSNLALILISISLMFIFFKGAIKSKFNQKKIKWGDYILSNFFEIFEILLGYFTNTISFVRIGVFIFVHAGMMMVVFNLAEMSGNILYPLIIILGNIFVTCFEALLVGMQVMRLQFCELFGRFFEGGGREFKPIVAKMKKKLTQ